MLEAECRFRRVSGYPRLTALAVKIERIAAVTVNLTLTHRPMTWPRAGSLGVAEGSGVEPRPAEAAAPAGRTDFVG
jgi:hypothetical protein